MTIQYTWHKTVITLLSVQLLCLFNQSTFAQDKSTPRKTIKKHSCFITAKGIDHVTLGMSYAQFKQRYATAIIEQSSDGEGIKFTAVYPSTAAKESFKPLLRVYVSNDPQENDEPLATEKIVLVSSSSPTCQTKEGIKPGSLIKNTIKHYGGIKRIIATEIESREYVEFIKAPPFLGFQINYGAAILPQGKTTGETKQYQNDARIIEISVGSPQ